MLDGDSGFCVMASGTTYSVHHIHYCTRSFLSAAIHRGTYVSMPSQTRRYASICDRGGLAGRRKKRAPACLQCPLQTLASGCLQTCPLPFSLLTSGMYYGMNTLRVVCRNPPGRETERGCQAIQPSGLKPRSRFQFGSIAADLEQRKIHDHICCIEARNRARVCFFG